MKAPPCSFDAVLFDLDGTLVATDRFWVQAARTGARQAFEELGLRREIPGRDGWMSVVGLDVEVGFRALFPDLDEAQRRHVLEACLREERRLLDAGGAALMPGAEELLGHLTQEGLALGIASNCSQGYLDHMLQRLGLDAWIDAAYCLDSPGIRDKADMIEELLTVFGTRSAVMVGDRLGDRDAAWDNGLPHVHCAFGFAGAEEVCAQAVIEDLGDLRAVLERRRAWIAETLSELGVGRGAPWPRTIGVTGDVAAGKTLFARDAARVARAEGIDAVAITLEPFLAPRWRPGKLAIESAFELEELEREVLAPLLARGTELPAAALLETQGHRVSAETLVFLEGPLLLDPRLAAHLDRVLYLKLPEAETWRRLQGRDARAEGPRVLEAYSEGWLAGIEAHRGHYPPERLADRVLDGANPLGPESRSAPQESSP